MLNIYLLIAVVAGALAFSVVRATKCPLAALPGPWYSRFTRLVLKYHILAGREMYYLHAVHQRYGPVVRISPTEAAVANLVAFAQIGRIVGGAFLKGPWYNSVNPGIFAMPDPPRHGERRRLFARASSKTALRANWEREVRRTVEKTVGRIQAEAQNGGGADVLKWWTLMATDVIAHLSFGESFDMVGLGRKTAYVKAIQSSLMSSGLRRKLPWLHAVARHIPVQAVQEVVHCDKIIAENAVKAVRNLRQSGGAQNLFSQMVAAYFDGTRFTQPLSPKQKLAFSPFGMELRVCLGIHLARMELRLATALFFRECRGARLGLGLDTTDAVMEMEHHFLIAPKGHFCNVVLLSP
ncbi:hypothetical protein PG994_000997 [Apiospora phragmitis]|uniref:Cytochrome P450 n=1 Tax=Apiospora phragmitis TaxID=2905665 RepID=A0ABR1WR63_9PEZI